MSSIVEYLYPGDDSGHRCGYCKSPDGNHNQGMWVHVITGEVYEGLINLGWRRSGSYMYKPTNSKTCCAMYTIRNVCQKVSISKSQRKVLKKFKLFIETGKLDNPTPTSHHAQPTKSSQSPTHPDPPKPKQPQQPQSSKPHPLKKKPLRRERKRQKLLSKGLDPDEFFKQNERKLVQELSSYFVFTNPAHKFEVKLIKVDSQEFNSTFEASHELYQKYQMATHHDTPHECRPSQFKRFLCDNPFKSDPVGGTFHQHYYVDEKLIAVGVIDILPSCVSSVYFYYDPDYPTLSLGTLGALQEINFVNTLSQKHPTIQYYYLGFYIHTCVKMKYKGNFKPAQLVCPVTNEWVDFTDTVRTQLDSRNGAYTRLCSKNISPQAQDITQVRILSSRTAYDYDSYPKKLESRSMLQHYVDHVSSSLASKILLYVH